MTTMDGMREQLRIREADLEVVNALLTSPDNPLIDGLLDLVEKYGGVDEINRKADEAGRLENAPCPPAGRGILLPRGPRVAHRAA